ncbi:ankyrin repeat-containing domain protein [Hypoxylon crocopeplum]|nr:ankyrin repeat-containing domain protein [Hypoxylon crocopeplum]
MGPIRTLSTTEPDRPRGCTPAYTAPEVEDGSSRGRSADVFSLGAVFLEMLVAHSFRYDRSNLNSARTFESNPSYAKRLKDVQEYMGKLERKMNSEQHWERMIIGLCRNIMKEDRDERPAIEDVYRSISSLPPPNEPPEPCCMHAMEDARSPDSKRLVEICRCGNGSEVDTLLGKGASSDTVRAIHQASAHGFENIVRSLLTHGTDVNLCDHSKQTALHCATGNGHDGVVGILLENEANPNPVDDEGRTPLHCASGLGRTKIVSKLLARRARVTAQDQHGQTALHFAARGKEHDHANYGQVIQDLLKYGADVKAVENRKRKTPREYAEDKNYKERARLLGNKAPGAALNRDSTLTESTSMMTEELGQIIQPPRQYSTVEVQQVSDRLEKFRNGWGQMAKIYIVLSIIVESTNTVLELMTKFAEGKVTDYRLPISRVDISSVLESTGALARFKREQAKVLTEVIQFDE